MRSFRLFLAILLVPVSLFTLVPRSKAQTLPDCPWPVSTLISATVTYTLTENCKVTGDAQISGSSAVVTINGGGFSVDASGIRTTASIIISFSGSNLIVNNISFIGGGHTHGGALQLAGDATISNTTFRDTYRTAILNSSSTGGNYTLTNILVEDVTGSYFNYGEAGMAVQANHNAVFTIDNMVMRNAKGGNAAVGIFPNSGASVTMTGCFTADGVYPQAFFGAVDTSGITGACSGSIGNGGTAARQYPPATASACGMPLGGFVEADVTYTLSAACALTGILYIVNGATVTIDGNGHTITTTGSGPIIFTAGQLTIRNAILSGGNPPIKGLQLNRLRVSHSTFREIASSIVLLDHSATIENTVFEDNVTDDTRFFAASAIRFHFSSDVIIRDSVFRNNIGAAGALYVDAATPFGDSPSLNLEGCITAENNIPGDFIDGANHITDSSTGPCDKTIVIGPLPPPSPGGDKPHRKSRPDGGISVFAAKKRVYTCPELAPEIIVADLTGSTQCQRIGAAGVGKADVLAAGLVDAVDVWSWVAQDTLVCFQARGPVMVFLDATYAPRAVELLPVYQLGELTCTAIEGAGSVVLLNSLPVGLTPPELLNSLPVGLTPPELPSVSLSNCMVRLRNILNLRQSPGGELIDTLPYDIILTALNRRPGWFEVDYHGQRGWISADYVDEQGDCA